MQKLLQGLAAGTLLGFSGVAHAAMTPKLSAPPSAAGGNYAFSYSVYVPTVDSLNPAATAGATCPGPGNTVVQCIPAGTFFTVYDIPGLVGVQLPLPGNWTYSIHTTGLTPANINGSSDSANLSNVTFTYVGPFASGGGDRIGPFTILSSFNGVDQGGAYSSQNTSDFIDSSGKTVEGAGFVEIPKAPGLTAAVPAVQPPILILMSAALAACGLLVLRIAGR